MYFKKGNKRGRPASIILNESSIESQNNNLSVQNSSTFKKKKSHPQNEDSKKFY